MLVGEVGINRKEYLYDLLYWEIDAIIEGYHNRSRHLWSSIRWQTYNIMAAFVGGDKLAERGVNGPKDLIRFEWEIDDNEFDDEYANEMKELIKQTNEGAN